MPRAETRYTIRFNAGTDSVFGGAQGGYDTLPPAMLAAWETLRTNAEAIEAIIYHGNMYVGKMKRDGRLYDSELRQIGVCITHDRAELLV